MSKKQNQKICVYCGLKATSKDHVPPKQMFPEPRPDNLETVPACTKCNNSSGKDEEYFLATFMFSEVGVSGAGKKLWQERLHRRYKEDLGLRRKIVQNLSPKDIYTPYGIFIGKRMTIELDMNRIYRTIRKIIKGLYYIEYREIMSDTQDLDCLFLQTQSHFDTIKDYADKLKNGCKMWTGIFQYKHNRTEEGLPGSMWLLNFYDFAIFWVIGYENITTSKQHNETDK